MSSIFGVTHKIDDMGVFICSRMTKLFFFEEILFSFKKKKNKLNARTARADGRTHDNRSVLGNGVCRANIIVW